MTLETVRTGGLIFIGNRRGRGAFHSRGAISSGGKLLLSLTQLLYSLKHRISQGSGQGRGRLGLIRRRITVLGYSDLAVRGIFKGDGGFHNALV